MGNQPSNPKGLADYYIRAQRRPLMRFWWWVYHLSNRLRSFFAWFKWTLGWEWVWWSTERWTAKMGHIANCKTTLMINEAYRKDQENKPS